MDLESQRIKEEEQLRADLAREQLLGIATTPMSLSNINRFAPAEMVQSEYPIPDAEPYSTLTARQAPSSIVGGMFSPEISRAAEMDYMLKRQAAMQNEAMAFAQLTPMQQAQFGFYRGGQQLGDALGGALGGKDPQLQMISLQQQILSELDPSDPEQQLRVAQKYARTAPELAMKIADSARTALVRIKQAKGASKLNVTAKVQEAEAYASKFGIEGSVEYNNAYKEYLQGAEKLSDKQTVSNAVSGLKADLRILEKQPQPNQEAIQRIKDQIQSIDPNKQIRVLFEGDVDQTTSNVSATASQKGETAFSEQLGKIDAKQVEDAMLLRNNSISALGTLEKLNKLDQQGLISGSFATGRVGAANILATIGLISEKDQGTLAASQNYQKISGDLVLATLGGKLGSGFSNEDRKFILGLVPQLETNALARKQLIEFMVKKNRDIITETTRLDDYARDNKSLKGFVPKIPIFNVGSGSLTTLSDAELIEQAEKRGIKVRPK